MEPEPNEAELAQRARDGDREALSELVEGARLRLFALAYAELRHYVDPAEISEYSRRILQNLTSGDGAPQE